MFIFSLFIPVLCFCASFFFIFFFHLLEIRLPSLLFSLLSFLIQSFFLCCSTLSLFVSATHSSLHSLSIFCTSAFLPYYFPCCLSWYSLSSYVRFFFVLPRTLFISAPLSSLPSLPLFFTSAFLLYYFHFVSLDSLSFVSYIPSFFFIHFSFLHRILLYFLISSSFILSLLSLLIQFLFLCSFFFVLLLPLLISAAPSLFPSSSFFLATLFLLFSSPSYLSYCTVSFILVFLSIFLLLPLFNPSCRSCFPCPYFLSFYRISFPFLKRWKA